MKPWTRTIRSPGAGSARPRGRAGRSGARPPAREDIGRDATGELRGDARRRVGARRSDRRRGRPGIAFEPRSRSGSFGDDRVRVHVRLDERSAGFFAIGLALASCRPVVVVVTSGTAAAELHPAVVEADLAGVPLVVCTADRPPELRGVGAAQTIDQQHLFGRAVRHFADPGVPGRGGPASLALVREPTRRRGDSAGPAARARCTPTCRSASPSAGGRTTFPPVGTVPVPGTRSSRATTRPSTAVERLVAEVGAARRGVVVAGRGQPRATRPVPRHSPRPRDGRFSPIPSPSRAGPARVSSRPGTPS